MNLSTEQDHGFNAFLCLLTRYTKCYEQSSKGKFIKILFNFKPEPTSLPIALNMDDGRLVNLFFKAFNKIRERSLFATVALVLWFCTNLTSL